MKYIQTIFISFEGILRPDKSQLVNPQISLVPVYPHSLYHFERTINLTFSKMQSNVYYMENLLLRLTPCQILDVNDYEFTLNINKIGTEKLGFNPRFIETEFVRLFFFP